METISKLPAEQTDELRLEVADKQHNDFYLEMVKKNGLELKNVVDKTEEICLTAINQNYKAFKYVKKQTYVICLAAVKQNIKCLKHIHNLDIKRDIISNMMVENKDIFKSIKIIGFMYNSEKQTPNNICGVCSREYDTKNIIHCSNVKICLNCMVYHYSHDYEALCE